MAITVELTPGSETPRPDGKPGWLFTLPEPVDGVPPSVARPGTSTIPGLAQVLPPPFPGSHVWGLRIRALKFRQGDVGTFYLRITNGPPWLLPTVVQGGLGYWGDVSVRLNVLPVYFTGPDNKPGQWLPTIDVQCMIRAASQHPALGNLFAGHGVFPLTVVYARPVPPPPPGPVDPSAPRLTWFQAMSLALAGLRIRREGWRDRYLKYDGSLWWMQTFNAVTKADVALAVVVAPSWNEADFRAQDWRPHGEVDAALIDAVRAIRTVFP
ncbi:MAG: hypothetical protein QOE70_4051 [Chthoniobacter sp.]|jgi:hypothetical protein|nr:hypothetical protein [Chthoniobacter sp.]